MEDDTDDETEQIFIEENQPRTKRYVLKTNMEDEYERTLLASGISIDGMDKGEIQQLAQVLLLSKQDASETCDVTTDSKKSEPYEADSDSTQAPVAMSQDLFHSLTPASVEHLTVDAPLQGEQSTSRGLGEESQPMETDQPPAQVAESAVPLDNRSPEQNPPSPVMSRQRPKLSTKKVMNKEKEDIPSKRQDDQLRGNRHPVTDFVLDKKLSSPDDVTESSKVLYRKYRSAKCKMLSRFELFAMGVPWQEYTKVILKYFNDCQKTMLVAQRKLFLHSSWGEPVKVGRHHTNTIDIRRRGQPSISMELSEEEIDDGISESLPSIQQTLAVEDPVIESDMQWLNVKRTTSKRTPRIESSSEDEFETIKSRRLKRRRILADNSRKKQMLSKEIDDAQKRDAEKIDSFFHEETQVMSNTLEDNVNVRITEQIEPDLQISQSSKSSSTVSASQGPIILNEMGDIYSTQMIGKKIGKRKTALDADKSTSQDNDIEINSNQVKSSERNSELESRNVIQATALESQGFDIHEMRRFSQKYTIKRKLSKDNAEYVKGEAMSNEAVDDEPTRSPVFERSTTVELKKIRKRSSSPIEYDDTNEKQPILKLRKTTLEFDSSKVHVDVPKLVQLNVSSPLEELNVKCKLKKSQLSTSKLANTPLDLDDGTTKPSEISQCKSTFHDNSGTSRSRTKPFRWDLSDDDPSTKVGDGIESQASRQVAGVSGTSSRPTHQVDEQGDHGMDMVKKKSCVVPLETVHKVPCPLCEKLFSPERIEEHASECVGPQEDDVPGDHPNPPDISDQTCYICDEILAYDLYEDHLSKCLTNARQRQERLDQGESNSSQEPVPKRNTRATLRRRPLHEEVFAEPSPGNDAERRKSPEISDV